MDSVLADFVDRMKHRLRSNQWISETAPRLLNAKTDETHPVRLAQHRKLEDRRVRKAVLRKREGKSFQKFVNARYGSKAYNTATCVSLRNKENDDDGKDSADGDSSNEEECFAGVVHCLLSRARDVPAPIGERKTPRDSLLVHEKRSNLAQQLAIMRTFSMKSKKDPEQEFLQLRRKPTLQLKKKPTSLNPGHKTVAESPSCKDEPAAPEEKLSSGESSATSSQASLAS
jgi:hypothetical protein